MGHANLSNISEFFVRRLYARGTLTIHECVAALVRAGEKVCASEGEYDDEGMLSCALEQVVDSLDLHHHRWRDLSIEQQGGPYIQPIFEVWHGSARVRTPLSGLLYDLLGQCEKHPEDGALHGVTGDRLEEEGHAEWGAHVRDLPALRRVYEEWRRGDMISWDTGDPTQGYDAFDRIPWRFAPGWRKKYRHIPLLGQVTT